jgi:hypothetical protein
LRFQVSASFQADGLTEQKSNISQSVIWSDGKIGFFRTHLVNILRRFRVDRSQFNVSFRRIHLLQHAAIAEDNLPKPEQKQTKY